MARAGTSSWPTSIKTSAHPEHELVHLLFNRNSCDVCRGALAGKLGYRCERCNYDVHCECLPEHQNLARGGPVQATPPRPYAHHPPPSKPSSHAVAAPPLYHHQQPGGYNSAHHHVPQPFRPRLNLSLSGSSNFDVPHHQQQQQGGQTPLSPPQPPQYYPAPQQQQYYPTAQQQQSYGNYYGRGSESVAPVSYNNLQQQQDYYPSTNNYGDYVDNYSPARDAYADDNDSGDYGDGDDY